MSKTETKSTVLLKHHLKQCGCPPCMSSVKRSRPALPATMSTISASCKPLGVWTSCGFSFSVVA
jgi:hypothetical protein